MRPQHIKKWRLVIVIVISFAQILPIFSFSICHYMDDGRIHREISERVSKKWILSSVDGDGNFDSTGLNVETPTSEISDMSPQVTDGAGIGVGAGAGDGGGKGGGEFYYIDAAPPLATSNSTGPSDYQNEYLVGDADYSEPPYFTKHVDLTSPAPPPPPPQLLSTTTTNVTRTVSRRQWLQLSATVLLGGIVNSLYVEDQKIIPNPLRPKKTKPAAQPLVQAPSLPSVLNIPAPTSTVTVTVPAGTLEPINFTQVAAETNINVSLMCDKGCLSVDPTNFTKVKAAKVPSWYPAFLTPPPKVVKEFPNSEILIAATVAGGITEMVRTSILYPIQTIKTRIQTDVHNSTSGPSAPIEDRLAVLTDNFNRRVEEGNLYAGIKPTLLVSVPATGVYFGVRDVAQRMLSLATLDGVIVALGAALVADIVSLCFRTPANTLALRLQAQDGDVGDWFGESLERLPMVIVSDLPYLLSKILLNRLFIHGSVSIDRYAEFAVLTAIIAAFLTTPFDVAQTRILVDSDGDFSNGLDGGSGEGVFEAMRKVAKEGEGGIANLFAGWFERVLYLGIGRAWLEPIQIIGYVGIRDAVLLEWF